MFSFCCHDRILSIYDDIALELVRVRRPVNSGSIAGQIYNIHLLNMMATNGLRPIHAGN